MATTKAGKLRVMVDANILIAGAGWPRFPYEVLQHAVQDDFTLVLSPLVIDEARRHILRLVPEALEQFEEFLTSCDYEQVPTPSKRELEAYSDLVRDPTDIPIALAAINAQVDCLVTQDRDFTDRDKSTKELHRKLTILLPGTFLREHMGWTSEALEAIRTRTWDDLP
jgi:predicted nucleic acid-binding protein